MSHFRNNEEEREKQMMYINLALNTLEAAPQALTALLIYNLSGQYGWVCWLNVVPGACMVVWDFCFESFNALK